MLDVLRLGIALLMLTAGLSKVIELKGFIKILDRYQLFNKKYSMFVGISIPMLKLIIGISLLTGIYLKVGL